jgi:hypothetical protein
VSFIQRFFVEIFIIFKVFSLVNFSIFSENQKFKDLFALFSLTPGITKKKFRQGTRADISALLWTVITESSRQLKLQLLLQ